MPLVTLKFTANSIQQAGNRPQMPINTESLHSDRPEDIALAAALLRTGQTGRYPHGDRLWSCRQWPLGRRSQRDFFRKRSPC